METTHYILSPLKPIQLPFRKLLVLMAITLVLGLAFGALYEQLARLIAPSWLGAAWFHTVAAVIFLIFLANNGRLRQSFSLRPAALYLPSVLIVAGVILAVAISKLVGGSQQIHPDWSAQLAFILWVPLIEEIVFRGGIGSALQKYSAGLWGMWFSALIFAWVHTMPTFGSMMAGQIGVPIGPFLLGLICEYLRVAGGSLVPSVIFHMVCNGSVVVFSLLDARWMSWLSLLYS